MIYHIRDYSMAQTFQISKEKRTVYVFKCPVCEKEIIAVSDIQAQWYAQNHMKKHEKRY